ncbi:EamA family transporter [Geothrix alkalitolerans]|uniref:EamA family transporter n=1 Tax=Geothrix alkalitolerans TaxID=2922724 RepID=UPI001FAF8619|nr:EamA family transporter [Geothrix alkalitolerans]
MAAPGYPGEMDDDARDPAPGRSGTGRGLGFLLVAVSGVCFGLLPIFNRQAAALGLRLPTFLAVRFLVAGGALWLWLLLRGIRFALTPAQIAGFVGMGALYVVESGFYFASSRRIPVALTALLLYLYPAMVALWEVLAGRHRLAGRDLIALLASLLGTALAVGAPGRGTDVLGLVMGLATAFGYTAYILLGARLQKGVPSLVASAWIMSSAGLMYLILALGSHQWEPALALRAWKPLLGLAVVGTLLPIPLLLAGMARVGAARASVVSTLEPLAACLFGALFLREILLPWQWVGAALILGAVILLSVERRPDEPLAER